MTTSSDTSTQRQTALEELLRESSELFLSHGCRKEELTSMSKLKASGAFLLLFESEEALRDTLRVFKPLSNTDPNITEVRKAHGPAKFQFMPADGIAFLYEQMSLPPPPVVSFNVSDECVVAAVVCLSEGEGGEDGVIYQNVFVYRY